MAPLDIAGRHWPDLVMIELAPRLAQIIAGCLLLLVGVPLPNNKAGGPLSRTAGLD